MFEVLGHTPHKERLGQQGCFGRVKRGHLGAAHYYVKDACEEGRAKLLWYWGVTRGSGSNRSWEVQVGQEEELLQKV